MNSLLLLNETAEEKEILSSKPMNGKREHGLLLLTSFVRCKAEILIIQEFLKDGHKLTIYSQEELADVDPTDCSKMLAKHYLWVADCIEAVSFGYRTLTNPEDLTTLQAIVLNVLELLRVNIRILLSTSEIEFCDLLYGYLTSLEKVFRIEFDPDYFENPESSDEPEKIKLQSITC